MAFLCGKNYKILIWCSLNNLLEEKMKQDHSNLDWFVRDFMTVIIILFVLFAPTVWLTLDTANIKGNPSAYVWERTVVAIK